MSVRNAIVLLLALSTLSLLIGCGSSTNHATPPPTGGFSDTDFSGTYTFSASGGDTSGTFAMAGSLVACGCAAGTISSGNVDYVDPTGPAPAATIGNNSTYTISSDGRGFAKLMITPTGGTVFEVDIDFVLTSNSHGLIIRFDANGTGSGTIDLEPGAVTLGNVAYAFFLSGSDNSDSPLATAGAFTLSAGTITPAGVEDFNYNKTLSTQLALTGSVSTGSGTTPGTATLDSAFGNLTFDVYAIDSTHLKLIENDGQAILVGDLFTQTTPAIPAENLVFTMTGLDSTGGLFAAGGLMSSDGTSMIPTGSEDINDGGVVDGGTNPATPAAFTGTFAATGGGRFLITLTGFAGGSVFAAYPSDGGLFMLEEDTGLAAGVTSGIALAQAAGATINPSAGYGLNLTGQDVSGGPNNGGELDEIAEFKTTSSAFTNGLLDENDGGPESPQNLGGPYTVNSDGSGSATGLGNGLQSMFFYAVDSTTVFFISTDPNQAAQGLFQTQTTPSAGQSAALQTRSLPMLRSIPHSHSASQRSKTRLGLAK
ncbi:MAG: hypothetical protein WB799_15065 [Candidatus Sulfotelmatobacter sp.]